MPEMTITLDEEELRILKEGLDAYAYWQISDERYRHSGFIYAPGADDEESQAELKAIDALMLKLGDEPIVDERLRCGTCLCEECECECEENDEQARSE